MYDFAGEAVSVTEEVDADSKKARDSTAQVAPISTSGGSPSNGAASISSAAPKRPAGAAALLAKLGQCHGSLLVTGLIDIDF